MCFTVEGRTFGDLVDQLIPFFNALEVSLGIPRSKVQCSGGVFPLPDTLRGLDGLLSQVSQSEAGILVGLCRSLNSYYGVAGATGCERSLAKTQALEAMRAYASDFGWSSEKFEGLSWDRLLRVRGVDYRGEEVKVARRFTWANIEPALPEAICSIPLEEVCEGGTLDYVTNFHEYLLPVENQVYTKPPRVFVDDDEWATVCSGLIERKVCRLIPRSEVFTVNQQPIFNGLFAVSKEEFVEETGVEICRLIMNLVPTNKLVRNLGGDVSTLPSVTGMASILLDNSEVLTMSSEDIRCFFYLFEVPACWHKFLAFAREVPASVAPVKAGEPYFLASRVLPMGFISSVAIAQHIHRRIARLSLHGIQPSIGSHNEVRKDKVHSSSRLLYRVYLDNFDILERMDRDLAEKVKGTPSVEAMAMRQGYLSWGMPRHPKKSVQQALQAEIQGAIVDGRSGKVTPKPGKVMKYVELAWLVLKEGKANQKQMQIICGGFVYCCMFRRALLGMLNQVWKFILSFEGDPPVIKRELPPVVQLEMVRFVCALPLAQMNLRSHVRGDVTASDASETGGGFCISNGLTPMGCHAANCQVRGDVPDVEDHVQVLTVGLFDGIGALRVSADALKLPMAGHISAEVSREGSRVLESQFPDSVQVGDVGNITENMVRDWAVKYSNVGVVLVGGGPPCQGVSGLNASRKGALRDARSSLFTHVKRVYHLCCRCFPWAQTHYIMESVSSMDEKDRAIMTEHMESLPYAIDAGDLSLCRRPRLYWVSWEMLESPEVEVEKVVRPGWGSFYKVTLHADVAARDYLTKGWALDEGEKLPTFTTARPRSEPGDRPAGLWQCQSWEVERWKSDAHRYPPYVYRDKHCLKNSQGERRLASISEKEVIMGFPKGYTEPCVVKSQQQGQRYLDTRHTLIGNSWHVPSITWILKELFWPLGLTPCQSVQDAISATAPGVDPSLQGYLRRPPLNPVRATQTPVSEMQLTRKLLSFVSVKGEDLLLQADTENQVRFHRLRASVPAKLWKWKTICGWGWKHSGFHINALEMQAVHTCLQWRLCRKRQHQCRILHLTDSLVTLHALTRGRSSSRRLRPILSKINALLLACDVHPVWGYVSTKQNPADRPSRLPVNKSWGKKQR